MIDLAMGWRHLLFASWPVDPEIVARYIPEELSVDTHDGQAWFTVVPFTNVAIRPRGLPPKVGYDLPELNLRTYVTAPKEDRPAVYFYSIDAGRILGVLGARAFYQLPYYYARIRLRREGDRVHFRSRRAQPGDPSARFEATYGSAGERIDVEEGSLAEFLMERYRFYVAASDGTVRYADIDHEPWPIYEASASIHENTLFRANNLDEPEGEPLYYYSPGIELTTSPSRRL